MLYPANKSDRGLSAERSSEINARFMVCAGASGLLPAPVSYATLTDGESAAHYRAVACATAL